MFPMMKDEFCTFSYGTVACSILETLTIFPPETQFVSGKKKKEAVVIIYAAKNARSKKDG